MAIGPHSVVIQDKEPIAALLDDEVVMLSARAESYFGLDRVGSEIWNMIAQPRPVFEICAGLIANYDVEPHTCESDVIKFLNELLDHHLIVLVGQEAVT